MDPLYKGALATGIAAATGMVTSLPTVDAEHFSPATLHGVVRLVGVIVWVIIVAEARYWKAWADKITGNGGGG